MHIRGPPGSRSTAHSSAPHSAHSGGPRHTPSAAVTCAAGRIQEGNQVPRTRGDPGPPCAAGSPKDAGAAGSDRAAARAVLVLEREVRGEVVGDVVGVPHGRGGADGADDLLRRVGVMTSHVVPEGELGEAELAAEGAREGVRRVRRVPVVVAAARGARLAVVEVVIGARQDALHWVGVGVTSRCNSSLK